MKGLKSIALNKEDLSLQGKLSGIWESLKEVVAYYQGVQVSEIDDDETIQLSIEDADIN